MAVQPRATRAAARRRARLVRELGKLAGGGLAGLRRRHHGRLLRSAARATLQLLVLRVR